MEFFSCMQQETLTAEKLQNSNLAYIICVSSVSLISG